MSKSDPSTEEPTAEELADRVAELEAQVDRLTPDGETPAVAQDEQGRSWTLGGLMQLGLTRREAMVAMGLLVSGVALREAFVRAVSATPGDDGDTVWGASNNRDDYYADEVDANLLVTDTSTVNKTLSANLDQGTPSSPAESIVHGSGPDRTSQRTASADVPGDNSATAIIDMPGGDPGAIVLVVGHDQNDNAVGFTDFVMVARLTSITTKLSETRGTPGARSYSRSSTELTVAIDDSGTTYDVTAQLFGGND